MEEQLHKKPLEAAEAVDHRLDVRARGTELVTGMPLCWG
jgi:hypothetical protein